MMTLQVIAFMFIMIALMVIILYVCSRHQRSNAVYSENPLCIAFMGSSRTRSDSLAESDVPIHLKDPIHPKLVFDARERNESFTLRLRDFLRTPSPPPAYRSGHVDTILEVVEYGSQDSLTKADFYGRLAASGRRCVSLQSLDTVGIDVVAEVPAKVEILIPKKEGARESTSSIEKE